MPTRRSRRNRDGWQVTLLLGLLTAFGPLSIDMYLPGLPAMSRDLHAAPWAAQLTLTACMLGLAVGQMLAGPISDAHGRRLPLVVGIALFALSSLLCGLAPGVATLLVCRFVQGAAGAAGIAIARAVVRDLHSGKAAARLYALLMVIMGIVPILAPLAGGQLLAVIDWRGLFFVLAGVGALLMVWSWWALPETLPVASRSAGGLRATLPVFAQLLRDREFVGYLGVFGFGFSIMAAYFAGSPFVLQDIYGLNPQWFSIVFASNVIGLLIMNTVTRYIVDRTGSARLLRDGLYLAALGGAATLAVTATHAVLPLLLASLFVTIAGLGLIMPNVTALALADHPDAAGSASGLTGLAQFACAAAISPLVGIAGNSALPMGIVIAAAAAISLLAYRMAVTARRARRHGTHDLPADVNPG